MTAPTLAPPRSPTRPCAFCGGPAPTRPAVADQPPLPQLVGDGPLLPEGTRMHDTPTEPIGRVTVTRQRVTPARPRVHPAYREWLDTPLDHTEPPKNTGLFVLAVLLLAVFTAAILTEVIT